MKKLIIILSIIVVAGVLVWVYLTRSSVVVTPTPAVEATPAKSELPWNCYTDTITTSQLFTLTNVQRTSNGLPALVESPLLTQAATLKAQDEITNHYWGHDSPTGVQPWDWFNQVGYSYIYAGENLAQQFVTSDGVMTGWMNSPGHRANILNVHYLEVGFAVVCGMTNNNPTTLVVAEYGSR